MQQTHDTPQYPLNIKIAATACIVNNQWIIFTLLTDVPLQDKILNEVNTHSRPDSNFLQSFAAIIGSRWQCLASPLSLTSEDIVSIKGADPTRQALAMLQKWAASETATYGQLRERLCTLSVFHI